MIYIVVLAMFEFDWDEHNQAHVEDHGVFDYEVEECFEDKHRVSVTVYNTETEKRRGLLGKTAGNRVLFIVYTMRDGRIRVVTARGAEEKERRRYRNASKP